MVIITKQDYENRIKETFPNQPFEVLEYTRITKPVKIRCLNCGHIRTNKQAGYIFTNKNLCKCYGEQKVYWIKQKEVLSLLENQKDKQFVRWSFNEKLEKHTVVVKCLKCEREFEKPLSEYLIHSNCFHCETNNYCDAEDFKRKLKEQGDFYSLIGDYINGERRTLIKHNKCGFIWEAIPRNVLKFNDTCPKCRSKRVRGE